jgi:hypothetical protein
MKRGLRIFSLLMFPVAVFAQTRNDAGLRGDAGAVSGFFEANAPVNFPSVAGAYEWWHLLDIRHSNPSNNYAMQFSGNFFNQQLFFRKTNDNASQPWSRVLLETDGKVGIGTTSPATTIDIRGSVVKNQYGIIRPTINAFSTDDPAIGTGGSIAFGGKTGNANPEYAFAFLEGAKETNASNNYAGYFSIRTVSGGENGETQSANYERLRVTSSGNVGIGTTAPEVPLTVYGNTRIYPARIGSGDARVLAISHTSKGSPFISNVYPVFLSTGDGNQPLILDAARIGVGTANPLGKFDVNGTIRAKEVKVETANWPDYVFAKDYALPSLKETEKHIQEKGHLPGIPSAKELETNGIAVGDMLKLQQKKIEELTLYIIDLEKRMKSIEGAKNN